MKSADYKYHALDEERCYTLTPSAGGPAKILATGTGLLTNEFLAKLDTTSLDNGEYELTLLIVNVGDNTTTVSRNITVASDFKLGNFKLSFTDMTIPVSGFPLTVIRSYDSLRAKQDGDFGKGWSLELANTKVEVKYPAGSDGLSSFEGSYTPFRDGTRVVITLPGGKREGFTFFGTPGTQFFGQVFDWIPKFYADAGVTSQLITDQSRLTKTGSGEYLDTESNHGFNPADPVFGGAYTLKLRNGTELAINAETGELASITDLTGNSTLFTGDSIESSAGRRIQFARDWDGRITSVIDSQSGKTVSYAYDGIGNLVSVTDPMQATTQFAYRTDGTNFLDTIIDPFGREAARTEYGANGRVSKVTDAAGKTIEYTYDLDTLVQTVTDQLGHVTTITLNNNGDAVREVGPTGSITTRTFDNDHRLLSETLVVGLEDSGSSETNDLTTSSTFDINGNQLTATDKYGNVTRTGYNGRNQPTSQTDAFGNTTQTGYDPHGLPTSIRDANGNVTSLKFDVRGNPTEIRDDNGNLLVTNAYNQFGEIISSTSVFGRTTYFDYDLNGNQVASWYFGGIGPSQVQVLNKTEFDQLSRNVGSVQAVLPVGEFITTNLATAVIPAAYVISQMSTVYNPAGQVTSTTDSNGLQTQNTFDVRGQLIQTRRESVDQNGNTVWLISRTAFDAAGRTIASTSQYVEGTSDPVYGTLTTYDAAGRVTLSQQVRGLVISITGTANNEEAIVTDDGTFISSSSTSYDDISGRVTSSVDSYGRTSQSTYNEFGDVTESRRQAFDENGNSVWFVTRRVYDSFGRTVVSTEEYPEGTSEPIRGTQTVYDPQGRPIQSIQRSGIVVAIDSATGNSTRTSDGTIVSQNQTTYSADGRVAFTTDAYGLETHTTYDSLGRTTETRRQAVDGNGNIVWLVSRTVFDSLGRVDVSTDQYLEGSPGPIYGTRSIYDELGRTVQTVRLEGVGVSINSVTGNSTLTAVGTPLWQTETIYNDDGTVFKQIAADGQITEYEYDAFRRQVAVIGTPVVINGQTVRLRSEAVYDDQGRTLQQRTNITQFADGTIDATDVQTTSYEYDSRGNIIKTTYADGTFVAVAYDDLGRKISETNPMGLTRTFTYDSQGRLASVTLPDLDGNPATTNDIATYGYRYDARGNMVQLTDPLGRDTRFTFNNQGQQLTRTLPLGFGADGMFGTADDSTLPEGDFTEHAQYDTKGRMTLETSFEGVITEYVYDDGLHGTGRLTEKRFYKNQADYDNGLISESQAMTYDAFGREVRVVWDRTVSNPGKTIDTWTNQYDAQGWLRSVASPTGTVFYEYDGFGRQTRVTTRGVGFQPADSTDYESDIRYSYDVLGRLSKVETFERNNVAVDVDPNTAGNQPEADSYAYTLNGNLDYEVNPDGSTTDYTYDVLNRATNIDEYRASTTTPNVFTDNPKLSEYSYTLRADGKKESADEIIYATDGTTPVSHTLFGWTYDKASRLTDEVFTDVGNLLTDVDNYHAAFEYDLTGNRLTQTTITDTNHDGVLNAAVDRDEVTTYTSDANDRMLSESTVVDGVATESTTYGFTGTQQTSKTILPASGTPLSAVGFSYNLQGRMSDVVSTTFNPTTGTATRIDTIGYRYGTDGIRISARQQIDTNADGHIDSVENTEYLIDANNHTSYQQVLQETVTDANGNLVKKIVYTIGLDHISQTTFTPGGPAQGVTAVFHMDGHGSTRILTDLAGTILNIAGLAQIYHYTAYGEAINFQMGNAATQYLYSGEQFDARIEQQYLRARYYDSATGTFNRLDPFFGNQTDPQSFHRYRYTSGDPIQFADPTGLVEGLISLMVSVGNNLNSRIGEAQAKIAVGGGSIFYLRGLERSQQLLNLLIQKGQNLVAWEQRIADASGDLIGRFRIDALIERVTNGTRVFTQIESKGVRWDFAFRNSPAWTTYLDQMTRQASAFSRAAQTANGQPIQERVIVFSSKVPLGAESFRDEILRRISEHYDEVFWGLEEFELWLGR